jgi:hypothetical protein
MNMSKAKTKAEAIVIEESAIVRCEPIPEIPSVWKLPAEPSWDHARALINDVRRSITAVIELGAEIRALRDEFLQQGARTDLLGRQTVSANINKGWQEKVEDELGISHVTALKIMERAFSLVCMRQIETGEPVEYMDSRSKEQRILNPTPELQQQATKAIEAVVAGTVAAPRAWAGLIGEGSRVANQGGSSSRANVDHAKNLKMAITKLRTSLKEWKHISGKDRIEIEEMWQEIVESLPVTMTLEHINER